MSETTAVLPIFFMCINAESCCKIVITPPFVIKIIVFFFVRIHCMHQSGKLFSNCIKEVKKYFRLSLPTLKIMQFWF